VFEKRFFLIIKEKTSCRTKNTYLLYLNFVCWVWGRWKKMLMPCALLVSIQQNRVTKVTPELSLLLPVGMLAYVLFPAGWLTWRTSRKSMKSILNVSSVVVVVILIFNVSLIAIRLKRMKLSLTCITGILVIMCWRD